HLASPVGALLNPKTRDASGKVAIRVAAILVCLWVLESPGRAYAERAQQPDRLGLLSRGKGADRVPYHGGVRRENPSDQLAPARRELEQNDPAVRPAGAALHQPPVHELVHHVGGAAALDQDAPPHLAHRQLSLVVQHLQDPELGGAEPEAGDARPGMPLDRVESPGENHPQAQGRVPRSLRWLLAFHALGTSAQGRWFQS